MNDKHDYGEYMGNHGGELVEAFIEKYLNDTELLYAGIEYAIKNPCREFKVEDVLECVIDTDKAWAKKFDEYCESEWESFRDSGPEHDD